jgi:hypothetical protein
MLAMIFMIGVVNLALGFGLAVALNHAPPWRWKFRQVRNTEVAKSE